VFKARVFFGVKVKILLVPSWVTVPITGVVPGPVKVKVVVLMVAGFIAWGKVTATTALGQIPLEPFGGVTEVGGAGGTQSLAAVVKDHTKLLASAVPNMFWAPVVIVAVNIVLTARLDDGVKIAVSLAGS
jgi:hypothetical protein